LINGEGKGITGSPERKPVGSGEAVKEGKEKEGPARLVPLLKKCSMNKNFRPYLPWPGRSREVSSHLA